MRLGTRHIISKDMLRLYAGDYIRHVKYGMARDMADEIIKIQSDLIQENYLFNGDLELRYEVEIVARGETERIRAMEIKKAKQEARPVIVDDFGNEIRV